MKKKVLTLIFTFTILIGLVAAMGMNASAATCPIDGATGAGTEADPVIVDMPDELRAALAYDGTLYIVAKSFPTEILKLADDARKTSYYEVVSKKVLTLKQNFDVECLTSGKYSLFSVKDGADFTLIADGARKIDYTYTVLELAGPNAKATLKGELRLRTVTEDGSRSSYALVAHQGNILLDGGDFYDSPLTVRSASLQNGAAVLKNCRIDKAALKGAAFKLYQGCVGYLKDKKADFGRCPDFGTTEVIREDLFVACIGGFNEQSPALEGSDSTLTAAEEKVIFGMSKKYGFSSADNTSWAEDFVYTPKGTIEVIDSTNNIIYSKSDSDSGTFDKNVSLSIDLKDVIKAPGKYKIRETISLTRDGISVSTYTHIYPIDVVEFNTFLGQSPAMPAGNTEFYLGVISKTSYPLEFYSHSISSSMIAEGYTSVAKLQIYDLNGKYVYGEKAYCTSGKQKISYDLNMLPADIYHIVETIELRDKDNKVVKSAVNTFYIDWTPVGAIKTVNIDVKWTGAASNATSSTKGVKVTSTVWKKLNGSTWQDLPSDTLYEGNTYSCRVKIAAESGYELASDCVVKISGITASKSKAGEWCVDRSVTKIVDRVYVYDIAKPEVGAYPDFTGDEQSADTAFDKAEWFPCTANGTKTGDALSADDKFEKGYYRLEVTVKPPKGQDVVFEKDWQNVSNYDFGLLDINGDDAESWFYPDTSDHTRFTMWIVYHTDDAEGTYKLTLGGVTMKDGDYLSNGGSEVSATKPEAGYAYYKDGVLTLEDYHGDSAELIFRERHLEINLIGENELKSIHNGHYYYREYTAGEIKDPYCLTIGGSGSLEMWGHSDVSYVFAVNGDINITGGKLRFDDGGCCGTFTTKNITISGGAEVEFQAYCQGLTWGGFDSLTVEDGSFYALDGGSWNNYWISEEIAFPKGYVYVYDYGSTLNPINPGIGAPKLSDSHKWDGVTPIGKYDNVWILSEEICFHSYDNACDAVCNDCREPRTPAEHTGGTATCKDKAVCTVCENEYGALADHSYNAATCTAPETCKTCGLTKGTANGHKYDNACDTSCNTCGATRTITHDYAAATCTEAKKCKVCGEVSGSANGHKYDNACDTSCNTCGATRTITHDYAAATCTKAKTCKVCGATSGSKLGHNYTNACDSSCNTCGTTRTITHDYAAATCTEPKTCKVCEETSGSKLGHNYTNACDTSCNTCGATRTITHDYAAATCTKAKICKVCGATSGSKLGHKYSNACDTTCNTCSAKRTITHSYKSVTTKATLTKNGKVENKCSVCGKIKSTTTVYYPKTIKLSKTEYKYNGKVQTPSVTVKDSKGNTLKKDTDYTVKYESGRKLPGKYTVTITFKGKYTGTKKLTYTIAPKATSKVTATQTLTTITLKWNKVTGADGYRIYQYNTKTKKYEKVKDVTGTTLKISKLKSGTKYKFKVRAYTKDDGTIMGAYSSVFETATKAKTPTLKATSTKKGAASLSWTNVTGESGYQVYYATKKDGTYKKLDSYKVNVIKATASKLTSGKTYYFKVRAYTKTDSGTVYSAWSTVKSAKIK